MTARYGSEAVSQAGTLVRHYAELADELAQRPRTMRRAARLFELAVAAARHADQLAQLVQAEVAAHERAELERQRRRWTNGKR
jgi:hypothetical protein